MVSQWRSTLEVLHWFNELKDKDKLTFPAFDIVEFSPSISEELLRDSLK